MKDPGASTAPDFVPSAWTGWIGAAGFGCGLVWLNRYSGPLDLRRYWEGLILLAFCAVPMMLFDAAFLLRRSAIGPVDGISRQHRHSISRTVVKLVGLLASLGLLLLLYWVFPEYRPSLQPDGGFYSNFFAVCRATAPWALLASAAYLFFVDARMTEPHDGYWHFGQVVLLNFDRVDWTKAKNHLRTWAVKGFFLPLMFVLFCQNLPGLIWRDSQSAALAGLSYEGVAGADGFLVLHHWAHNLLFTIDLAFVVCGYLLTLRLVQSHVRSAEPTALGWTAALICYQPFWTTFGALYFAYGNSGLSWDTWLAHDSPLFYVWGLAILFFESIFVWASISFGLRFSNLTHRGIIRFGPYYFTRHPAYVAKIVAFALISVPFIDRRGITEALRNCLMLAANAFVYWVRAKTEERHLASIDPAYGIYSQEIHARHQRWLGPLLNLFRSATPPAAAQAENP